MYDAKKKTRNCIFNTKALKKKNVQQNEKQSNNFDKRLKFVGYVQIDTKKTKDIRNYMII